MESIPKKLCFLWNQFQKSVVFFWIFQRKYVLLHHLNNGIKI